MRIGLHHKIGKKISSELKELGCYVNERLFLLGNIFPDLCQSYLWRRHEHLHSRNFIHKKIEMLKKRPKLFSFHLGVLAHYICDYFCYPHSSVYSENMLQHILYELRQKIPKDIFKLNFNIKSFAIEELDKFVDCYEEIRPLFMDDEYDFQMAAHVSLGFIQAAYL